MPKLDIPGRAVEHLQGARTESLLNAGGLVVARRACVEISTVSNATITPLPVEVNADSVLVLHLEGGFQLFLRQDQFVEDFRPALSRGGDTFVIDPNLGLAADTRGLGGFILKGIEVFEVAASAPLALQFASKIEKQLDRAPGLYQLKLKPQFALSEAPAVPDSTKAALIFIHGTGSSTRGSYTALASDSPHSDCGLATELAARYGENVFAFEHRTLTESPIQNALALVQALPVDAELHLVSHSRGGLVGELLACGGSERLGIDTLFEGHPDQSVLKELLDALQQRRPRVTRFVRVACPARGTTLASGRADRWFSMLLSVFGQGLGLVADPLLLGLYNALQDFLLAFVHEKSDPAVLPGIAAMLPTSPLVRWLNIPGAPAASGLSVIAGSSEGQDFLGKLKLYIPDAFYGGRHDLVVNYASMDGGRPRSQAVLFADRGPGVNHFHYFINPSTRRALLNGLSRQEDAADGFQKIDWKPAEIPSRQIGNAPRPVVFMLPGLFGSELAAGGERIWLDYWKLTVGGLGKLAHNAPGVQPVSLIRRYYAKLIAFLSATHEVIEFPFDWRVSLQTEAARLAHEVSRHVEDSPAGVQIVAHSMGGLLARVMIAQNPELWNRIKSKPNGRLLMLGTPNGGAYEILRIVTGQSRTIRQLTLLDLRHSRDEVVDLVSRFTGLLELLPPEYQTAEAWKDLAAVDPRYLERVRDRLETVAATRRLLNLPCDDRMAYVAGLGPDTAVAVKAVDGKVVFMATSEGDGHVPWATGIPANFTPYYSLAQHGDLANHEPDFPALLELLNSGATARLPRNPPAVSRDLATPYVMPAELDEVLPNERDLAAAALGASAAPAPVGLTRPESRIRVEIVHGNLSFARHTVAVGHYSGDSIVGAEASLDRQLAGRLSHHHQLGVYPDRIGTAEVFLSPEQTSRPPGAIVIGLGKVGSLSPQGLQQTYYSSMLRYALAAKECQDDRFRHSDAHAITTVLVGTMASVLSIEESLTAMLRAVRAANLALDRTESLGASGLAPFRIRSVEVLELWEDRVIHVAEAVDRIAATPEFQNCLDPRPMVITRDGGLRRHASSDEETWWSRLRITQAGGNEPLRFALYTNRARTEVEEVREPQRASALIESAIGSAAMDLAVSQALFEMLVPNRVKEFAPELNRVVLMVDEHSARFPWELFHDRMGRHNRPLAVDTGLIRQLELEEFRPVVLQSDQDTALVVGNPVTARYPALPGAEAEGRHVISALEGLGVRVTRHIGTTGAAIRRDLYSGSYRILHLAGHGVHAYKADSTDAPVSGMVIGDNDFLTAAEIGQLRPVPELVFLNCCHQGRLDVMAANLAVEFMRIGVRAIIAAGWAVDDRAAETFSAQFYQSFLQGKAFGEAVRDAREAAYERHRDCNTWGAYQCYGDPGYRFKKSTVEAIPVRMAVRRMVLPAQLPLALDNLARQAKTAQAEDCARMMGELQALKEDKGIDPAWWDDGAVQDSEANLLGELGLYRQAMELYGKAAASGSAHVPIRALEQEANMRARGAAQGYVEGHIDGVQFQAEIDKAIAKIDLSLSLGETTERYWIKASAHKRKAMLVEDAGTRNAALREMIEAYRRADGLAPVAGEFFDARVNWVTGIIVLRWFDPLAFPDFELLADALEKAIDKGRRRASAEPSFWNAVIEPNWRMVRYLASEAVAKDEGDQIGELYWRARTQGGSPREAATIVEHLEFLQRLVGQGGRAEIASAMARLRERIRIRLG